MIVGELDQETGYSKDENVMSNVVPKANTLKKNPLLDVEAFGQSIWMDYIRRGTIASGELQQLIEADGVSGVTSNPSIFEKAIAKSRDYDESIHTLTLKGKTRDEMYQFLTVEDIQSVADLLRPTYNQDNRDGFVSLEVSPGLHTIPLERLRKPAGFGPWWIAPTQ